jgi:hypothetical protein
MAVKVLSSKRQGGCVLKRFSVFVMWTAAVFVTATTAWAAEDPMVGDWKLNPQKSKLIDVMKVASLGENKYSFDFGGGDPLIAVADGTDQPGNFGITIGVTINAPNKWTVVRKKDGKVLATGVWTLARDGSTLTDHFTAARPNGDTTSLDYVYKREGGGSGFAGTWVSASEQVNSTIVIKVRVWETDGLSFITSGGGGTKNVKFDGKDYANVGAVVEGQLASARRMNDRTIDLTDKMESKVIDTQEMSVSGDGKTLTITVRLPGRSQPDIEVFEKQ